MEQCRELISEARAEQSAIRQHFHEQENVLDKMFKWIAPCPLPNRYSFQHIDQYTIRLRVDSKSGITL